MSRKGENIFKRNDGRYEGRYVKDYICGKAIYGYVYAKTYDDCKKKRNKALITLKTNEYRPKMGKNTIILNNLIYDWLNSKSNIKESSYTRYYNLIEEHIKYDIGKVKINKLTSDVVNSYINNKLTNGKKDKTGGLSKNTVYDICNILKQVFKKNNININMIKISKCIGNGKSLYLYDKNKLINYLEKVDNNISLGILLSLNLGLRESEVCGIRFCDIDLKNKIININHIISRVKSFHTKNKTKLILSTPKTENSKRSLPIPNKLYNKLLILSSQYDENCFLLTGKNKFIDPRTFYNRYKKILKKLNIKYTYHDLRHTFATNCITIGIDYKSLMELLGHSSITTTMNIYAHPSMGTKRKYINKL